MKLVKVLTKHIRNFPLNLGLGNRISDDSPCGIALRANNSILVESIFHGASRKGAKDAKFGEICTMHFSLKPNKVAKDR